MADLSTVKAKINSYIVTNGANDITGDVLNEVLIDMCDDIEADIQTAENSASTAGSRVNDFNVSKLFPSGGTNGGKTYTLANAISKVPSAFRKEGVFVTFISDGNDSGLDSGEAYTFQYLGTSWAAANFGRVDANIISEMDAEIATKANQSDLEDLSEDFNLLLQDQNGNTLYVTDPFGNVVAKIDSTGITAVDVTSKNGKSLSQAFIGDGIVGDMYENKLYISDSNGNVVAYFDDEGLHSIGVDSPNMMPNSWGNKVVATYGDSVTAVNNGDFNYPFSPQNYNWGNEVAKYYSFATQYGRGIGSTTFMWRNGTGGQVAWVDSTTGAYVGRNDSYNYDNYSGNVTIPTGCTAIRGDGCSWLRITSMFPASIKDNIDAVLVMFMNDYHQDMATDAQWIANDTTDTEWAASAYYSTYDGDYNINCVKGGIASTIMKLQAWMPDALIILMTPISGVHADAGAIDGNFDNTESALMRTLAEKVKDVAFRMSIPCIDNYGTDGINSLNRTTYIKNETSGTADNIHPYSVAGRKKVARSVISGLISIIPNI